MSLRMLAAKTCEGRDGTRVTPSLALAWFFLGIKTRGGVRRIALCSECCGGEMLLSARLVYSLGLVLIGDIGLGCAGLGNGGEGNAGKAQRNQVGLDAADDWCSVLTSLSEVLASPGHVGWASD